jgi:hypothetical protein
MLQVFARKILHLGVKWFPVRVTWTGYHNLGFAVLIILGPIF